MPISPAASYAPTIAAATPPEAAAAQLHQGGAVAAASILYILLAVAFGLSVYQFKIGILKASLIFIPLVFVALYVGHRFPLPATSLPILFGSAQNTWKLILLIYCFVASILPVWILLQPRDYLSSFLLYSSLAGEESDCWFRA